MRLVTLGTALCRAILTPARAADADSKHLSLGEVAVVEARATHMTGTLKSALDDEMKDLDLRGARFGWHFACRFHLVCTASCCG